MAFWDYANPFGAKPVVGPNVLNWTGMNTEAKDKNAAEADAMAAKTGRPDDLQWADTWDDHMNMSPEYERRISAVNMDKKALNQFQSEALRKGPSQWANLANAQQRMLAKNARDRGAREVAGQGATARSALAMRGGLGGGAAERVAMAGQNNYMDMSQNVARDQAANMAQIGMNDEQNRITQLGMVPGMQAQATGIDLDKLKLSGQAKQFDLTNQMRNKEAKNAFDLGQYQSKMNAYGSAQVAAATQKAGKHKK